MLGYLSDVYVMLRAKWSMGRLPLDLPPDRADLRFCYDVLESVSRSFAMVIKQLPPEIRDAVCVFYLVLRALDTIEDDMTVSVERKLRELPNFHTHLSDPLWSLDGVGAGEERALLQRFPRVSSAFRALGKCYQRVILDICARMAAGMCDFLTRPVETRADYDLYCHYVAGLVGHGLTRLFAHGGLEDAALADDLRDANAMGLFLQKTNIVRDYYEDVAEDPPRVFWPREVWGPHVRELRDLRADGRRPAAMACVNEMVADALQHAPAVVRYLAALRHPAVVRFCAIPQLMAMATLAAVCNNPEVLTRKVKMTRADTCRVLLYTNSLPDALRALRAHALALLDTVGPDTAGGDALRNGVEETLRAIDAHMPPETDGVTRSLLTKYPALGGGLLYSLVDNIVGYLGNK